MKLQRLKTRRFTFVGLVLAAAVTASGAPTATITLDRSAVGKQIPADFAGLSFETSRILPDGDGSRLFTAENKALISLFKTLGIHSLRIGGNTADRATVPIPSTADIDSLFGFAKAAEVKVIYTLRLHDAKPEEIAATAKYVMDKYGPLVSCLAIGNEPNVYAKEYPAYREMMEKYLAAVKAAAPTAVVCGPSTTPGKVAWARSYAKDFGPGGQVKFIAQHSYPGNSANKVADPADGRKQMLSKEWVAGYQKFLDTFAPTAKENGLGFRLEEANSFFNGGRKDASDTFASALWALDYMHWWASHGASGLNFHTGDKVVAAGAEMKPCWYATFVSVPSGYELRPIAYAIKAFDVGGRGKSIPVNVSGDAANLTAYATLSEGRTFVTLINKDFESADPVKVSISGAPGSVRLMRLSSPNLAMTTGVSLGGSEISGNGAWAGQWESGDASAVSLPPASAVIVELREESKP